MTQQKKFTGRERRHTTRFGVKFSDAVARLVITVGGIATIVAVVLVFFALAWEVVPLFMSPVVERVSVQPVDWKIEKPWRLTSDEYRQIGWIIDRSGKLQVFRLSDGVRIHEHNVASKSKLTAASFVIGKDDVALGFENGSLQRGKIEFVTTFLEPGDVNESIRSLEVGESTPFEEGVIERTPKDQFRYQRIQYEFRDPLQISETPIDLIDQIVEDTGPVFCVLTRGGEEKPPKLLLNKIKMRTNLLTGETKETPLAVELPYAPRTGASPSHLLLSGRGDGVMLIWEDGHLARYDVRNTTMPETIKIVEEIELFDEPGPTVTAMQYLVNRASFVCGDSTGRIRVWFPIRPDDNTAASDGMKLVAGHDIPGDGAAVTVLGGSLRTRMLSAGYEDGTVRLFHVTTDQEMLARAIADDRSASASDEVTDTAGRVPQREPILGVAIAPKDDGLLAMTGTSIWDAAVDPKYPEITLRSLFLPIWYEGYEAPETVWQSSSGTSGQEPKLGLYPLIFGTLKATFYSILFGAPLALLAAIYTSEFLHPRLKARIKPTIEMMASLPSVVLGFMAGIVLAPMIENWVPTALASLVTVPIAFILGAFLWQLLPKHVTLLLGNWRLLFITMAGAVGLVAAVAGGGVVEDWLFAGNIMLWLDGQRGTGTGGWMFLFLPLSALVVTFLSARIGNPWLRQRFAHLDRQPFALVNLAKFVIAVTFTIGLAYAFSWGLGEGLPGLLTATGAVGEDFTIDPRGTFVDTYIQRNTMIVGFVMGFAIIPIIYTIAEDALSTVPMHLRSASLGAGATQWQTAMRVVVPTAMSGLFSALMIGLGRAVGETMIMLMATGNTPEKSFNLFSGFRTLAATIAVELPEAPEHSTHYRTLFVAGLTLFALTFCVNTLAEVVRLRFRRRASQL